MGRGRSEKRVNRWLRPSSVRVVRTIFRTDGWYNVTIGLQVVIPQENVEVRVRSWPSLHPVRVSRRSRRAFATAVLVTSVQLVSCSESGTSSSMVASSWRDQLLALARGNVGVYSYRFVGPPPEGAFFRVGLHAESTADACSRYAGTGPASRDFWFLALDVNDLGPGPHQISLDRRHDAPLATANVALLHRQDDVYAEQFDALWGTVSIDAAPSLADSKRGSKLVGSMDVSFPLHALRKVECFGGVAANSDAAPTGGCVCADDRGRRTTCTLSPMALDCCHDFESERVEVHVPIQARPCPQMCAVAVGLPAYCLDVVP
jgi:hypothetical protein